MYYLVEDPFYPLLALGVAAVACLIALQVTQQGKFLIWAGGLLGAGLLWLGVERLVVTDAERVEAVVYELADAVGRSDVDAVNALLAPEVTFGRGGQVEGVAAVRLLPRLRQVRFDYLKIRQLATHAGAQSKRGTAEFKATASGVASFGSEQPFPVTNTAWSLGFREVSPGAWRVNRVTAVSIPRFAAPFIGGS